jgi:hypothetical protein
MTAQPSVAGRFVAGFTSSNRPTLRAWRPSGSVRLGHFVPTPHSTTFGQYANLRFALLCCPNVVYCRNVMRHFFKNILTKIEEK